MNNLSEDSADYKQDARIDYTRILRQIAALKEMRTDRGCTEAEAAVAARKIGEVVQRNNLVVLPPSTESETKKGQGKASRRTFAIEDVYAIKETSRAVLCVINGEESWIPLSQIHDTSEVWAIGDSGILIVRRWFAEKRGWCRVGRKS